MNLPFLKKKQQDTEYFLALLLSTGKIESILFEKTGESLSILGVHKEEFQESLDLLDSEKLIELSDIVITSVEEKLPTGAALQKTIFSVPHKWVLEGRIIKEHLLKLKGLCDALKLTPVGFIISIEAIIAYLHKKEGVAISSVFVEIGKKHVTLSLVKNGVILGVFEKEITDSSLAAVESILSDQEEMDILPSKIVLLDFEHAKKTQQAFLSHTWSKSLSFLHIPQVEILDHDVEAQAVISGVASQMGFASLPDVNLSAVNEKETPVKVAVEEEVTEQVFTGEAYGFYKDKDVRNEEIKEEGFGLAEDLKVKEVEREELAVIPKTKSFSIPFSLPVNFSKPEFSRVFFTSIFNRVFPKGKGFLFLYPILAVGIFVALVLGYYFLFEKVQITIFLDKKVVSQDAYVIFSKDKPTSATNNTVHIVEKSETANGTQEQSVTGKKETGDKATGEITIYNKTENSKVFQKGTQLIGVNNLAFTINSDVEVASTSSFATSFSNVKVKVTAEKFGKEYNLPSGTNFSIDNISPSDFFGKNDLAFSGGTKTETQVVSADDLSALTTKVVDTLLKKAIASKNLKKTESENLLPVSLDYSFTDKTFSKKEGDSATSVSLTATIAYTLGTYNKSDLVQFAKNASSKDIPSDFTYSVKDSKINIQDVAQDKNGIVNGKLTLSSVFLPTVSPQELVGKLIGKSSQKVDQIVSVKGVTDNKTVFTRSLPIFPKILPFNKNNIEIVIQTN